jgi:hypothetical protein
MARPGRSVSINMMTKERVAVGRFMTAVAASRLIFAAVGRGFVHMHAEHQPIVAAHWTDALLGTTLQPGRNASAEIETTVPAFVARQENRQCTQ